MPNKALQSLGAIDTKAVVFRAGFLHNIVVQEKHVFPWCPLSNCYRIAYRLLRRSQMFFSGKDDIIGYKQVVAIVGRDPSKGNADNIKYQIKSAINSGTNNDTHVVHTLYYGHCNRLMLQQCI